MVGSYNAGVPLLRNVMIADTGLPLYRPSMLRGRLESARDDAETLRGERIEMVVDGGVERKDSTRERWIRKMWGERGRSKDRRNGGYGC